jgi:hypothetical protein
MEQKSIALLHTVRNADSECDRVRLEKTKLFRNWTSTVVNVSKRDAALETFAKAIKTQEVELKGKKAEIAGTKLEIILCQVSQLQTLSDIA